MPDSRPRPPDDDADGRGASPEPLLLCGARLADGRTVDVRVGGERIEAVGPPGTLGARGTRVELRGFLLLPAPAEPHAHSDTALTASDCEGDPHRPQDLRRRATEAALLQLGHGATALRTHVRVGGAHGLAPLEAVLQARYALRGLADLTPVVVPRRLTGAEGEDGTALLRDAVAMGAGVIGGRPDLDPDPEGYVERALSVAAEHGLPVDLHTDASDPARIARFAAMAAGLGAGPERGPGPEPAPGRGSGVTLGPCGGLSRMPEEAARQAAERLAAAGVTVVCLPQGGCSGAQRRLTAPVRLLRAAGVRLVAGSGALRDTANPVGRGDPLEAAYLLASQHGLPARSAYDAVATTARLAMGLPEVRVEAGFPAELLAVRGDGLAGVLSLAYSRIVVHRGRIVARTSAVREYCDTELPEPYGLPRQGRPGPGPG
ncbi:hydrolase [Streptomyces sp. AM 2-1-1]|uniref:hydrolase n=1 Tax=Streptomyces sp. AM 2-1-1 TaxID=3028709 RepID=UPI0023B9FE91|nr:hydrolase [Streptomyces sp. AM 2-1-1]WEH41391.1 hydrolase [Streptomyces sp. AM 2-1-1]